jgi:hypothetical protein
VKRSNYKRRSNRSAKIMTTIFSVIVVVSVVLSLVGSFILRDSQEVVPTPTRVFPTPAPLGSPTPSLTPSPGIPTPILVTPKASP